MLQNVVRDVQAPRRLRVVVSPSRSNEENVLQLSLDITRITAEMAALRERLDENHSIGRDVARIAESLSHLHEDVTEVRKSQRLLESEALGKRVLRLESELEDLQKQVQKTAIKMAAGGAVAGSGLSSAIHYALSLISAPLQ